MPGLRKFDMGIHPMGPADQTPPGTMRRGRGIARVCKDSIKSRWGCSFLAADFLPRATLTFNGVRYFQSSSDLYDLNGVLIVEDYTVLNHVTPLLVAPVSIGKPDYLFLPGQQAMKKLASDGTVSDWGIAPFPEGSFSVVKGTAESVTIDALTATTGWTGTNGGTVDIGSTAATPIPPVSGADCVTLSGPDPGDNGPVYGMQKTVTLDLSTFGARASSDQDDISIQVFIDYPNMVEYITLAFSLGAAYVSGHAVNEYVATARFSSGESPKADAVAITNAPADRLGNALGDLLGQALGNGGNVDAVSQRSRLIGNAVSVIPPTPSTWFNLRIPKDAFFRGGEGDYDWSDVQGIKITFKCVDGSADVALIGLNDFKLVGSYGLWGTYKCQITAKNSVTGNESNPLVVPVEITDVLEREPLAWTLPTTHDDPQVDTIVLYRTLGYGGRFFFDQEIFLGVDYLVDEVADAPGLLNKPDILPPTQFLSLPEITYDNIKPEGTWADAVGPYLGRVFFTRDVTDGRGSFVYYTRAGYIEGVQGFITIGSDDESCQKLAIWNRSLYVFTKRGVYQIVGTAEPFSPVQIRDVPGTDQPYSVHPTPFGIVYEAADGFRVFTGAAAPLAPSQPIAGIFQGYDLEDLIAWSGTYCAAAGLDYYYVSDGDNLLCLDGQGRWRNVGIGGVISLAFEPRTNLFIIGVGGDAATIPPGIYILEAEDTVLDNLTPIEIEWETPHIRLSDPDQRGVLQRVSLDIDLNSQTLTPTLILDGVEVELAPITNTSRGIIEIALARPCRLLGIRLTGSVSQRIEWYGLDPDVHIGGNSQ